MRTTPIAPRCAGLLLLLALSGAPLFGAALTASVGLVHDDNVSGSALNGVADTAATVAVDLASRRVLSGNWQLSTGASVTADDWFEWNGLDQIKPALRAGLLRKFGFGPYAPVLEASATAEYVFRHYRGARGLAASGQLQFRQRLTPIFAWSAQTTWDDFDARDAIYSRDGYAFGLRLDADVTPDWRLTLQTRRRWGDMTGHGRGLSPLGDSIFGPNWTTVRYAGTTNGATINASRALGSATTVGAQFDYASTQGNGRTYLNRTTSLTLVHAF